MGKKKKKHKYKCAYCNNMEESRKIRYYRTRRICGECFMNKDAKYWKEEHGIR